MPSCAMNGLSGITYCTAPYLLQLYLQCIGKSALPHRGVQLPYSTRALLVNYQH